MILRTHENEEIGEIPELEFGDHGSMATAIYG